MVLCNLPLSESTTVIRTLLPGTESPDTINGKMWFGKTGTGESNNPYMYYLSIGLNSKESKSEVKSFEANLQKSYLLLSSTEQAEKIVVTFTYNEQTPNLDGIQCNRDSLQTPTTDIFLGPNPISYDLTTGNPLDLYKTPNLPASWALTAQSPKALEVRFFETLKGALLAANPAFVERNYQLILIIAIIVGLTILMLVGLVIIYLTFS
jgi:hypothetical protein